jgi:LacI family transcriptional regulator
MTITIHDVARRLKLSITTVSRALDGYADVAPTTRERVIVTARQMGYVPSRAARQLRRQRADAIGYILPTSRPRFNDPFFTEFLAGLGDEATSRNFDLMVSTAPPDSASEQALYRRWIQSKRVDGFVLSRLREEDWRITTLQKADVPMVAMGHRGPKDAFPRIEVDARWGFSHLIAHLVGRGHKRIAYIGAPAGLMLERDRQAGYRDGLQAAGLKIETDLIQAGDLTRHGGYQATATLLALEQPPSAIVCANDLTAIGAIRCAFDRGLRVGRDLAVAGYDGLEEGEHALVPLTTLRQPVYDIARRLVTMLIAMLNDEETEQPRELLRPELIIRASTG